ncbi:anaerobic selenocysteine-containing dehydrogenase [Novosphingobium hassiacum]|uniref:Anaerobic selenocysteine-containing dehydrogenase n=1 Tax=Novosphingobium hassiacum TaxID=173676 RepID=A0A7W6A2P2_9SPHN|nr:molybdopterin-dependent oxidoreductase [Novosphingobium hassiacum]MBB3862155.1 anaerobic selenocysteine-containing dehydrogenase [Novosphingobium hassiacum]
MATQADATTREAISFCRICSGGCGVVLTIDNDDRIVGVRGDDENPLSRGYACFKGRQPAASHHGRNRLLHPLKRLADGSYVQISSEQALAEIAEKLGAVLDTHGNDAMAIFLGNGGMFNIAGFYMLPSFLAAFDSDQYFSTLTIDQSGKMVTAGRLGTWGAGYPALADMDVALLFGANPLVSHAQLGFLQEDPVRTLKKERKRGLKLITVDPRRTETGHFADIALQPYPGQDAAIAGGLIRLILDEGWHDADFCDRWVGEKQMAALQLAVEPLTEGAVERRAGIEPGSLRQVAQMFARDAQTGCAAAATGTSMAPHSNLAFHLIETLNIICGRYLREGDPVHQINGMGPNGQLKAQAMGPTRFWEASGPSRIRGTRRLFQDRPTATLADEILTPGEGQIRALLIDGGDPMTSWPDQPKTEAALASLDLLVCIDPWPTPTTKFAHYILPPMMQYERADLPMYLPGFANWAGAWSQYTPPVIAPPVGADLVEDWYVFWSLAQRLGRTITYCGVKPLDMATPPTTDELLETVLAGAPHSLETLKAHPHGLHAVIEQTTVLPSDPGSSGQFAPMPDDVADELRTFITDRSTPGQWLRKGQSFTHLLSSRRMRDLFNSNGRFVDTVRARTPFNPAFLHPSDLAELGIAAGDKIEITSAHGRVVAIADADESLRAGVVSIAHGWGDPSGSNAPVEASGTAVNRLIDTSTHYEAINAMPHMSAIPVNLRRL